MSRTRVLVVEDDESYQDLYESFFGRLYKDEFIGRLARTGKAALDQLKRHPSPPIDAVVLDWQLPDIDGLSILRKIRTTPATKGLIVFMVTGSNLERGAEVALESRADDYIAKPFRERELYLKLRNHLERWRLVQEASGVFELNGLKLKISEKSISLAGKPIILRPKEFDLLMLLMERPDILHTQDYLAEALSAPSDVISPEALRQQVSRLRKALGAWGERIEMRYGQGYILHAKPASRRAESDPA